MEQKRQQFIIKGMSRDMSISKANPEFAFENMNIRITADDENNLLSITNEKGNKEALVIEGVEDIFIIEGVYLGYGVLNNTLILFTTDEGVDRIYRLIYSQTGNFFRGEILFEGELNFNETNPIETLCVFENEDIQKVYWVDGLNQPRVINISEKFDKNNYVETSFDFAQNLKLNETIFVSKNLISNGMFPAGSIQYAFSYYNKHAQESSIFYTTPLHYTSFKDRGGSPEDVVSNSFNISIEDADPQFDFLRVYSILRTSLDTTPTVKRVVDLPIFDKNIIVLFNKNLFSTDVYSTEITDTANLYVYYTDGSKKSLDKAFPPRRSGLQNNTILYTYNVPYSEDYVVLYRDQGVDKALSSGEHSIGATKIITAEGVETNEVTSPMPIYSYDFKIEKAAVSINYIDNGLSGDSIDPTELLFKGSDNIIAGTLEQKDNTLFLGNIKLNQNLIESEIINSLRSWKDDVVFKQDDHGIIPPEPKGFYPYENSLQHNSQTLKTFKYLDWYRLGLQFQHKSGKWSEPIFIKDLQNDVPISFDFENKNPKTNPIKQSYAEYKISNLNVLRLTQRGFVKARTVISYPDISDREVLAQGVLAPTVFNVSDRYTNTPFAQSSWFMRPNAPFDKDNLYLDNWTDIDNSANKSLNSKKGYWNNESTDVRFYDQTVRVDSIIHGSWSEFRHFKPLPTNNNRNAEIQSNYDFDNQILQNPYTGKTSSGDVADYVGDLSDRFFVDQSILTFHSPEIEFDESLQTMDSSNLKMRIVGQVPLTSNVSDIDIITSTPVGNSKQVGFYKEQVSNSNISRLGAKGLNSGVFWIDSLVDRDSSSGKLKHSTSDGDVAYSKRGFMVYPWHRNGSLNNDDTPIGDNIRTAMLDKKKMSNLRFSYGTFYFNKENLWNAFEKESSTKTGISGIQIFNSDQETLIKIPSPKNSNLEDINYYGNVDKIITSEKYPIMVTKLRSNNNPLSNSKLFRALLYPQDIIDYGQFGTEPIRMKYKSSPHAVMALNFTEEGEQKVLPTISEEAPDGINQTPINSAQKLNGQSGRPFWDTSKQLRIKQDVISSYQTKGNVNGIGYGFLWMAELYNDNVENRFGGTSNEAIENNLWLPGGEPVSLVDSSGEPKQDATVLYTEGDTFFSRYDCLKTYPSTKEDQNSIVDITSFMVESRINLDGRYDRNRGQINNLNMSPENFNKINKVYNQSNNYFNYRTLNEDRFKLDDFRNSIAWSRPKALGELTDTWSNITLASSMDLDGDKGSVNSIMRFNNEIFAFQDRGISRIIFNPRVQINASDNVPIEISNSGKVEGKVYLSDTIGVTNKWSIVNARSGLYFNDDTGKSIYRFTGEGLENLTDQFGFNVYFKDRSTIKKWDNLEFNNFITFYDSVNSDIYFINRHHALGFSEKLGQFTSFYNYGRVPLMFNIGDKTFSLKDNILWEQFKGDYNSFYGETKPFYTVVAVNQEPHLDKVFTNLEFRADTWNSKALLDRTTFDRLDIWNEYQHGTEKLHMSKSRNSNLKKKYRIWYANFPRDRKSIRDRIRNPWAYVKLAMEDPKNYKTELHDIIVYYYT